MAGYRNASRRKSHQWFGPLPALLVASVFMFLGFTSFVRSQELTATSPWVTTVFDQRLPDLTRPLPDPAAHTLTSVEAARPGSTPTEHSGPGISQADESAGREFGPSAMAFVPQLGDGLAEHLRFSFEPQMSIALGLLAFVLATSLLRDFGAVVAAYASSMNVRVSRAPGSKPFQWDESEAKAAREECNRLLNVASDHWRRAEPVVLRLDEASALRNFLMKELAEVTKRLSVVSSTPVRGDGAVMVGAPAEYWITLRQRLRRTVRDLERIRATADAALSTVGSKNDLPRVPESKAEALVILGANREIDHDTLQRLVRALRQCWHPDLARSDEDRRYRNARIAQINVAYDILNGRRAEG